MSNRYLIFLNLAHALSQRRGGVHVAILADGWKVAAIGIATTGATGPGTAALTLLQNVLTRMDKGDLYTTYTPTDADLGMARICRIRAAYHYNGAQIRRYKPEDPVGITGFTSAQPNAGEISQVKIKSTTSATGYTAIPTDPATGGAGWLTAVLARGSGVTWYDTNGETTLTTAATAPVHTAILAPVLTPVPTVTRPILAARGDATRESLFMTITYALLHATWTRHSTQDGNKVACILVDPSDRIVSWGLNMARGVGNPTWHGEVVTLRQHLAALNRTALGPGYKIYTTLKPCYMCAGLIGQIAPRGMTVIFGQDDPQIRNSTLDRNAATYEQKATGILRTATESFPQALDRLMTAAHETQAIPYLESMSGTDRGATFGRTLPWSVRMDGALRSQHRIANHLDLEMRTRGHRSNLAALDLAVPTTRQTHDHLWVLHQGLRLLRAVGAPVTFV